MLKLIIADDERIIRESIFHIIDWDSLGIEVIGLCQDGLEAYEMIVDEYPDIVLTDILMPELSGLELIEKVTQMNLNVQFILLSGYSEFSYAQEAMKYGVRHYLLKPCNEAQIIESLNEVIKDCLHQKAFYHAQIQQKQLLDHLYSNSITNLIAEGVSTKTDFASLIQPYSHILDFNDTAYELCYLYYLEEPSLMECLEYLKEYTQKNVPGIPVYGIYVHNTLLIFFRSYETDYTAFDTFVRQLCFQNQHVTIDYKRVSYPNLAQLLDVTLEKIKRYGTIYCINDFHPIQTCNYKNLMSRTRQLTTEIIERKQESPDAALSELKGIIERIVNIDFLKQLAFEIFICFSSVTSLCSPILAAEFFLELNQTKTIADTQAIILNQISHFTDELYASAAPGDVIKRIMAYVDTNLSDPALTLKWIAENQLYMNVDYLSKKFIRETGMKFSDYLTEQRIQKAKELLSNSDTEKIQLVAEKIGFGSNYQYFRQLFKKHTGMTPSAYVKKIGKSTLK